MKGIFLKIKCVDLDFSNLGEILIKVSIKTIKKTVMEYLFRKIGKFIKETLKMISLMDRGFTSIRMEEFMKVNLKIIRKMGLEN